MQTSPIKVLSFDPGTTVFGWSQAIYFPDTDIFEVQRTGILKASKIAGKRTQESELYGQRLLALQEIEILVKKLVNNFEPDYVASEDAFYNPRTPQAYATLLLCLHVVESVLYKSSSHMEINQRPTSCKLYRFAPRNIKKIATGDSLSFKGKMADALKEHKDVTFKIKDVETVESKFLQLTEHEIDAIFCGYTFIKTKLFELICA